MNYFWFRRDLRLEDNAGLYQSLKNGQTQAIFIFDTSILSHLEEHDPRVSFIHGEIERLQSELSKLNSSLRVEYGETKKVWESVFSEKEKPQAIYVNRDYEPYAKERDEAILALAKNNHCDFLSFKDQCIFEMDEVTKDDGLPYTVYTPYSKKWKAKYTDYYGKAYPTEKYFSNFSSSSFEKIPSLEEMGFRYNALAIPERSVPRKIIKEYEQHRDIPSIKGTSRLSIHFRFGTISIREKLKKGRSLSEKWVNELIWRDFYMQILHHFPHVVGQSFKKQYDQIEWRNNEKEFKAWCEGKTGYPIVDAGMRELNTTGFMHNRIRMVVSSFLTKHLLIDWRWGEAYFAKKLLDFELASNNGGWQWAAGSGVDAAPYFRIFNPYLQTDRFDKKLSYIKQWVPELDTSKYPDPIVDHKFARERCLSIYKEALNRK